MQCSDGKSVRIPMITRTEEVDCSVGTEGERGKGNQKVDAIFIPMMPMIPRWNGWQ